MKLTEAQINALHRLFEQYRVGEEFNPYDAFPARNAVDNGARRALAGLARRKVLERVSKPMGWYRITERAAENNE